MSDKDSQQNTYNMPKQSTLTQAEKDKEKLASELIGLAPYLDFAARMGIALKMGCSLRTVDRYLAGDVRKIPTGIQMLEKAKRFTAVKVA